MTGVVSCVICHESDQKLRFFHAPQNPVRLKEWNDILEEHVVEIKTSSIICEKHFLEEHITRNFELKCWRLRSKAIPTLNLTDEKFGDLKLINENDFDKTFGGNAKWNSKTVSTQTKFKNPISSAFIDCIWCDDCFPVQDMYDFMRHIGSQHRKEMETFFEIADNEMPDSHIDEFEEENMESEVNTKIERVEEDSDVIEFEHDVDTNTMSESYSLKSEEYTDDMEFEVEESDVKYIKDELVHDADIMEEVGNLEEIFETFTSQPKEESRNKMLPIGEESNNQINIETSDPSLVFYVIDLLQTFPQIWFINGLKSKEYEAALTEFCTQFSEKYQYFMTQMELHESLIEIRDWYQKVFEEKCYDELPFPQNEYYFKLAEFLPDKSNGKTCEICGCLFQDHVQYFAHKKLEHAIEMADSSEKVEETSLGYLKEHASDYFRARYPLYQAGFSYQCQICPFKVKTHKASFIEHIKTHLDIREHVCDVCGKAFVKQSHFDIHRKRHFGLHKFKCLICGKDHFTNFSLLTAHRKRYHRPIEGTIEQIEQIVSRRSAKFGKFGPYYLRQGEGNHKKYICRHCQKSYKYRSGVYKHFNLFHKGSV